MTALPRGRCPHCDRDVALRRGGQTREHRLPADPPVHAQTGRLCPGSGEMHVARQLTVDEVLADVQAGGVR